MANLYDTAKQYTKKDITSIESLDLKTLEVKDGQSDDGKIKFKYIEIGGWKYTIKASVLSAIQEIINVRPTTTKVKVYSKDGELKVMPLD